MARVFALLLLLAGAARAQVPLPPDVSFETPGPGIPLGMARFAGAWGDASWGGTLPTALIVERVDPSGAATVVYAVGAGAQFGIPAQWTRVAGNVAGDRLTVPLRGATAEFTWSGGGLVGHFTTVAGWRASAWLRRIPGDPAMVVASLAQPVRHTWTEVRIATGGGHMLQAFRYLPSGPGPHPVIVFNHGSTDGERPGVVSIQPAEAEARLFVSMGWAVIAPMRKGRGLSGGPMLEPSTLDIPSERQLESGIEDVDAVIRMIRDQPELDAGRVVVAGQSRGGMLAMAYAGRNPAAVAGVLNFAGGWWSERTDRAAFNQAQVVRAGQQAGAPMLWLYADRDSYYGLPYVRTLFQAFRAAGGRGEMVEFNDLPGNGHALIGYSDRWAGPVAAFLARIEKRRP